MNSAPSAATIGSSGAGVATVTRPAPDRRAPMGAERRRAGLAARAGDHQHAAEVALVGVDGARLDEAAHAVAGEQLEARPVEPVDDAGRDADVGDDDLAGLLFRRRQHQRQLRRAERDGDRRFDGVADQVRGVGRHARGQVDGDDRDAGAVEVGDDRLVEAGERPP